VKILEVLNTRVSLWFAATAVAGVVAACGGGGGDAAPAFAVTNLVSDGSIAAAQVDRDLVNPWGLVFNPRGFSWVANNGTSRATLYDGLGHKQTLVVSVPETEDSHPTGIVFNDSGTFTVSKDDRSASPAFIFAGENGTLSAWAPAVEPTKAITTFDARADGKIYKGLARSTFNGVNLLYATDFHKQRIDVFDNSFHLITAPGSFVDPQMPAGFAPFGIQAIGDRIFVAYAKVGAAGDKQENGPGLGALAVFDGGGNFVRHLATGGNLDAPWALAKAPAGFGALEGMLLVGNHGNGQINAFDPASGAHLGTLNDHEGRPISIEGLWGMAFGNGVSDQPVNTLFFTAGPAKGTHGLYGRIDQVAPK
jgi:uncharacterized protein (TIGR03118 family)